MANKKRVFTHCEHCGSALGGAEPYVVSFPAPGDYTRERGFCHRWCYNRYEAARAAEASTSLPSSHVQ